jgi:hypothetical protein
MRKHLITAATVLCSAFLCVAAEPAQPVNATVISPAAIVTPEAPGKDAVKKVNKSVVIPAPGKPAAETKPATTRLRTIANELRQHYDVNKNGTLEAAEYKELQRDMEAAERLSRTYRIYNNTISKLDTDNNLVLSNEELKKLPEVTRENVRKYQERRNQLKKPAAPAADKAPAAPAPAASPAK